MHYNKTGSKTLQNI